MANRDGTGPMGDGSVQGRGLGICTGINAKRNETGLRKGLARKRGFGHGFGKGVQNHEGTFRKENEMTND